MQHQKSSSNPNKCTHPLALHLSTSQILGGDTQNCKIGQYIVSKVCHNTPLYCQNTAADARRTDQDPKKSKLELLITHGSQTIFLNKVGSPAHHSCCKQPAAATQLRCPDFWVRFRDTFTNYSATTDVASTGSHQLHLASNHVAYASGWGHTYMTRYRPNVH